jgi:hypothetical protein
VGVVVRGLLRVAEQAAVELVFQPAVLKPVMLAVVVVWVAQPAQQLQTETQVQQLWATLGTFIVHQARQ